MSIYDDDEDDDEDVDDDKDDDDDEDLPPLEDGEADATVMEEVD